MMPYAQMTLDRLVRFPTREEALLFLPMNNVSDLGSDLVAPLSRGLVDTPLWKAWLKLPAVLYRSSWRYGALAVVGLRFLQPLYALFSHARGEIAAPAGGLMRAAAHFRGGRSRVLWQGRQSSEPVRAQAYEELKLHQQFWPIFGGARRTVRLRSLTLH